MKRKQKNSYNNWKCCVCNSIFRTRREMQNHKKEYHPNNVYTSWNKGLTKETSEKIKFASAKISSSLKGKATGRANTPEKEKVRREKISIAISKRNGLIQGGTGGRKDVKWYKVKNINGVEHIVRGTWELNVAKRLNELGILWLKNQRVSYIIDGLTKQYNPDFYLPLTNEFVEVKGWFKDKDRIKMNCVVQQHSTIRIFFIDNSVYQKFITDGQLNDQMLYSYRQFV